MATMVGTQKDIADLLNSLIELDFDAVEAYEAAIERLDDENDKAKLSEFKGDHERHVRDLQPLVEELGEKAAQKADVKHVLTKGKVVLASLAGDRMIMLAMKTNEDDTNTAYERAVGRTDIPSHIHSVLERNRDDERRHREYIEGRLEAYEAKEAAPKGVEAPSEAVPSSHAPR
jgi:uncharacterized protein (TIGR02284 family)